MTKYEKVALVAVEYVSKGINPADSWEKASCEIFEKGSSAQRKGCPKSAFLGLFGVNTGSKNAQYAIKAVEYLKITGNDTISPRELWNIVLAGEEKTYNNQMHVVIALFRSGKIK